MPLASYAIGKNRNPGCPRRGALGQFKSTLSEISSNKKMTLSKARLASTSPFNNALFPPSQIDPSLCGVRQAVMVASESVCRIELLVP